MEEERSTVGSRARKQDFTDVSDYKYSELREACAVYKEIKKEKGQVTSFDIMSRINCTEAKSRILLGAAEFYEKMRKKGLA